MPTNPDSSNAPKKQSNLRGAAGVLLAYGLTLLGLMYGIPWLFAVSRSWIVGFLLLTMAVPLFPAMQTVLMGAKKQGQGVVVFFQVYVTEFASLVVQFSMLLTILPFIAIMVVGLLSMIMLVAAIVGWIILGLQQVGVDIGRPLSVYDIRMLAWSTLGLLAASGAFVGLKYLERRYEDSFYGMWADMLHKVREIFEVDLS